MKTRDQIFAEFQREFDKKRLKDFWGAILFMEAILAMIGACFVIAIFMPDSKIDDIRPPFFVLGGMAIIILLLGFIVPLFHEKRNSKSEFHVENIIARLRVEHESITKKLSGLEKPIVQSRSNHKYAILIESYLLLSPLRLAEITGGEHEWSFRFFIGSIVEETQKQQTGLQNQFNTLQNQLNELSFKIEFYLQVSERTYWRYLRSFKWLKIIK